MGVYTLRPYQVTGDWTAVSGGSLADDSDSTNRFFSSAYQYGEARFSTSPIPFASYGMVVKSIKLRVRCASSTSVGSYVQITAFTALGRPLISLGDAYQFYVNGLSYVEQSTGQRVCSFGQADGDVVVSFHPTSPITTNSPKFSEAYLDVEFVYPPIPTVNFPTGTYTTTSSPPLSWTFFSQDGYPQTAYRYLIYRDDQYGAVGFIPGTTPADYDSGIIYSPATSTTLHPRVNDTYRVYVAVAQTVNGLLQWSLWTAASAFKGYVLNITPPAAPSVTATADNTNARINLAISGAGAANSVLDVYELQRSFDSGTTWETVRSDQAGGYLENVGGARVWYDYETGNGQSVVYRARTITYDTVGNTLVGAFGSNSSSVAWTSSSSWLKVISRPDLNMAIVIQELGEEDLDVPMGVFQGLDSDTAVTISGVRRSLPDSSIRLLTQTAAERTALKAVLALGETLLLQGNSRVEDWYGTTKYVTAGGAKMGRIIRGTWEAGRSMGFPYTEIERPDASTYLVEFGTKTWQDVDDAFATFTALSAAYTTYGAIRS